MASVFAYDPDPPRIASPWSSQPSSRPSAPPDIGGAGLSEENGAVDVVGLRELGGLPVPRLGRLEDYGLVALDAEPELGPVEYKLHLLLRQRQAFTSASAASCTDDTQGQTVARQPGVNRHLGGDVMALQRRSASADSDVQLTNSLPYSTSSPQSRQQRLLHLTTQLLWRLKQSSPYHSFSTVDSIAPKLPDASSARLSAPERPEKLLPGLEESQGAMYEIGLADDGSFVGLTRHEMEESLINLRAMAASLGCKVQILRAVVVGVCQPVHADGDRLEREVGLTMSMEKLYVVEAIVVPETGGNANKQTFVTPIEAGASWNQPSGVAIQKLVQNTQQLRVSLTGSTTSGKSTLLGTLLASTFDDARGKSRLNLLKHRHEIASGVTSSVVHELIGYQKSNDHVVNYAFQNVDSWTDMHETVEGGRLVLLTDSAGHPRYRRTIIRSLVAWQPHWTLCCIAAVYHAEDESGLPLSNGHDIANDENSLLPAQALALAHLELCLKLDLPLVVVITKYDLATRLGLRQILSRVLTILKAAGRIPHLLKPSAPIKSEDDLRTIFDHDMHEVRTVIEQMQDDFSLLVPIVLTSSVNGIGISKLHALLRQLPIPALQDFADIETATSTTLSSSSKQPPSSTLFNIDEVFVKNGYATISHQDMASDRTATETYTFVVSGVLKRGTVNVGDRLLLGPFSNDVWPLTERRSPPNMRRIASYPVTYHEMAIRRQSKMTVRRRRSSEDLSASQPERPAFDSSGEDMGDIEDERERELEQERHSTSGWRIVEVTSVRNLRLPVHTCHADQCATIGITPIEGSQSDLALRPRKGMVLLKPRGSDRDAATAEKMIVCRAFQAIFPFDDYHVMEPGMQFNLYVGSVRALAKVVTVGLFDAKGNDNDDLFDLDSEAPGNDTRPLGAGIIRQERADTAKRLEVMFVLVNSREYVEVGAKVFVMPGHAAGGGALALNGYVGTVSEAIG